MPILKLMVNGKVTHIPTREIVEVVEDTPTSTIIVMRNGRRYTCTDRAKLMAALQQEEEPVFAFGKAGDSLFERIFGRF